LFGGWGARSLGGAKNLEHDDWRNELKTYSARIDDGTWNHLSLVAAIDGKPVSQEFRTALEEYLARRTDERDFAKSAEEFLERERQDAAGKQLEVDRREASLRELLGKRVPARP
jgi:hypothetical protein